MKLHLVVDFVEKNKALTSLLDAADKRGIDVNVINTKIDDYFSLPTIEDGDLLYRHGLSERGQTIEKLLVRDNIGHFYTSVAAALGKRTSSYVYNERAGLPVAKTIPLLPSVESDIQVHVDYLGGFPLIVKVMGGSKGVGVIKVDSIEGLKSVIDYVRDVESMVLLREFIQHAYYGRLVVVGDRVVASHRTFVMPDEFRTNAAGNIEENKQGFVFSDEVQRVAVKSVQSIGLEYGGVDLLFADNDTYYISEVNFPCGFTSTERIAQTDIAGPMIDYLVTKTKV